MKRISFFVLVTIVASLISLSQSAGAQGGGEVRLGVLQCPAGYTGEDFAVDCTEPASGMEFFAGTPYTGNVTSGFVSAFEPLTFSLVPFDLDPNGPDTIWLGEWAIQDGGYAASCSVDQEPLPIAYEHVDFDGGVLFGISFDVATGDDIVCNWYRIGPADSGVPVEPSGNVVELPSTGKGPLTLTGWWA